VAARTALLQPLACSQDPIAQNNAVFYAVSAVSFARECVGLVWSDLADSNLLVSRNWGWRLGLVVCIFEDLSPCGSTTSTGCLKTMAVVAGKIWIP
jgi:hypothetical protein